VADFRRLVPPGADCDALAALAGWREQPHPVGRPRIAVNFVASVDARVTIDGRSAPLSGPPDRDLFHALRANADAVMAGASTMQIERYGPVIRDAEMRAWRLSQGLSDQPPAVIFTRSAIDPGLPLLADPDSHVIVAGPVVVELEGAAARVDRIVAPTLAGCLTELHDRFAVRVVICEGGPRLAAALAAEHVLDELFLSVSPQLVGGEPGPTILHGSGAGDPQHLTLAMLLSHRDSLYARYVVG
jgi:riboflavin biosynthesis pyrimidine reductase